MSIPRYQPTPEKSSQPENKKTGSAAKTLTAVSIEAKEGEAPRYGTQNYTKVKTRNKSLLRRPVEVVPTVPKERLPSPEVVQDLEVQQALMLLQPGASKEHTQKALDILDTYVKKGKELPNAKNELYKAAELIFEGKINSRDNVLDASKLIYLAECLGGWKTHRKDGYVASSNKDHQEFFKKVQNEINKYDTSFFKYGDKSIDEMQFYMGWVFQSYIDSHITIGGESIYAGFQSLNMADNLSEYIIKVGRSLHNSSMTADQISYHFSLVRDAINLGLMEKDDLMSLGYIINAFFGTGEIEWARMALNVIPIDVNDFNFKSYVMLFEMVEKSLLDIIDGSMTFTLEMYYEKKSHMRKTPDNRDPKYIAVQITEEALLVLCDKLKNISEITFGKYDDVDGGIYLRRSNVIKKIKKWIDGKLEADPKNENLIKAKLKILRAEINFSSGKEEKFAYEAKRPIEELNRFFDESNLQDPEFLFKKLQLAVEEGLVSISDVFKQRGEDLLYGRGMQKAEPEMAAKFFIQVAGKQIGWPLSELRRSIMALRESSMDEQIIKSYEKQFEELVELQQTELSKTSRETLLELLNKADNQMNEGDILGASISYLLLAKSNLSNPLDVFEIFSENKRVKEQMEKLVDMLNKSDVQEDRLWGKQLRILFGKSIKK